MLKKNKDNDLYTLHQDDTFKELPVYFSFFNGNRPVSYVSFVESEFYETKHYKVGNTSKTISNILKSE